MDELETGCSCNPPVDGNVFFCERHQCEKTLHWFRLCSTKAKYFNAWEKGRGPGQTPPKEEHAPPRSKALETPRRAQARKLACKECPDGHWDEAAGLCQAFSPERRCLMRQYFNGPRQICRHWPE
jgi:hypothetical protein